VFWDAKWEKLSCPVDKCHYCGCKENPTWGALREGAYNFKELLRQWGQSMNAILIGFVECRDNEDNPFAFEVD
jgi:hypothetical protein